MSREDFDDLFNQRFSAILDDKKFENLFEKTKITGELQEEEEEDSEQNEEFETETETESNLFGNIEKNLPELFGQSDSNQSGQSQNKADSAAGALRRANAPMGFTSSNNALNIQDQSDISSVEMEFTEDENPPEEMRLQQRETLLFEEGLNLSLKSSLDEDNDDFKAIEVRAIKNLKLNDQNNFVLASQASSFKQLIMGNQSLGRQSSVGQENEEDRDSLDDSLEAERSLGGDEEEEQMSQFSAGKSVNQTIKA